MYGSLAKSDVRSGIGMLVCRDLREVCWLACACLKNEASETPIEALPRFCVWDGVFHWRAPSRWKMRSSRDTCAGVRTFQDAVSGLALLLDTSPERRLSMSMAGSDSSKVEKMMFARCLFRLVIWTARTAA